MVEYLLSMKEALCLIPAPQKKEEKEEESKKGEVEQEKGNLIPNMLAIFLPP